MEPIKNQSQLIFNRLLEKAKELKKTRQKDGFEKALAVIKIAEDMGFKNPRLFGIKSKCLRHLGRLEEALEVARENCSTYENAISYKNMAEILFELNLIDEAIEAGEKNIELSGNDQAVRNILKRARERKNIFDLTKNANELKWENPQKALDIIEKCLEIEPTNIYVSGIRCECLLFLKKNEEALKEAQRGVEILASDVSYVLLAKSLIANKQYEEAVLAAENSCKIRIHKDSIGALLLAYCYAGQTEKFKKSIENNLKKITSEEFIQIGHILRKNKFYLETIEILSYTDQNDPRTHLCKAFAEMLLSRFKEALKSFMTPDPYPEDTDVRLVIRKHCGMIFLSQHILEFWGEVAPKVEKSISTMLGIDPACVGDKQVADYNKAMQIARVNFPDLFL